MTKREMRRATVVEVLYRLEVELLESISGNKTRVKFKEEDKLYIIPTSVLDKLADLREW